LKRKTTANTGFTLFLFVGLTGDGQFSEVIKLPKAKNIATEEYREESV